MKHKFDLINLVEPASPIHRARYSTNWDRKGLPGSEIQMYYGCPCHICCVSRQNDWTDWAKICYGHSWVLKAKRIQIFFQNKFFLVLLSIRFKKQICIGFRHFLMKSL